jgi:Ca2+-transporting ATPase
MRWHTLSIPEVLQLLDTNEQGLLTPEAERKLKQTGPNELEEGKKKSIASMFLSQFKDIMILILIAAAIISGFIGDLTDTIVIIVIVLLNAILGFYQEYRADKAMQAMKKKSFTQARVFRNKQITTLHATK